MLGEWAAHRELRTRIAWVSLGKGDNDPASFWAYVVAALQTIQAGIGETVRTAFESPHPPPIESALTGLLNRVAQVPDPVVLVLDDYHAIRTPAIHKALSFLLENMPPQMHLVLATRADPPLPIQLIELYESDLRFTSDEAAEFLNRVVGLRLSAGDVAALERRTEGWIAGLQMAAISMRGRDDISEFVRAFAGSNRYILDYLGEEVLQQQPTDVQAFLLQTAILDHLSGELCDAVIGAGELAEGRSFADSQSMLEYLERSNLFVLPLDDERRWYRYHRLFADLLRRRLRREKPELVRGLHRRASGWYEQRGLSSKAVGHLLAAADFERAAYLVEQVAWPMLTRGETMTLLGWLDALPAELVHSRPQLGVLHAWALAFAGQLDGVESHLQEVDVEQAQGDIAAVRAYMAGVRGDVPRVIELAEQALELTPEEKWFSRGIVAVSLGIAYQTSWELVAADRALTEAIKFSRATERTYLTMVAMAILGHVQKIRGLLCQAIETHREALGLASEQGGRPAPFAGIAYVGIAKVLYEWNDLEGAMRCAMEGINLGELGGFVDYALSGHAILARVHQAHGDVDSAGEAIQKAERLAQRYDYVYVMALVAELRARLWVARGNVAAASRWAREHRLSPVGELRSSREIEQTAVARVLIAHGEPVEALKLLAQLLEAAEAAGRMGSMIKILALQALAFHVQGDVNRALSTLERALCLAEPEGYVRAFVDEGESMATLLRQALSRGIAPNYVARLLAAFGQEVQPPPPAMEALVDPLTERELEVLRLVVAGLSNPEIADTLVIAISTVKSHINRIYGKLGVENRTRAVIKAQELALL